jgi:hypothetical protein
VKKGLAFNGFVGFLLVVDVFSHRVFCRAFKSKDKLNILKLFNDILDEAGFDIYVLQTDQVKCYRFVTRFRPPKKAQSWGGGVIRIFAFQEVNLN